MFSCVWKPCSFRFCSRLLSAVKLVGACMGVFAVFDSTAAGKIPPTAALGGPILLFNDYAGMYPDDAAAAQVKRKAHMYVCMYNARHLGFICKSPEELYRFLVQT